jgi:hypothetical protein
MDFDYISPFQGWGLGVLVSQGYHPGLSHFAPLGHFLITLLLECDSIAILKNNVAIKGTGILPVP